VTDTQGDRRRKNEDSDGVCAAHALRSALDEAARAPVDVEIA
jgi:hypothetical protein